MNRKTKKKLKQEISSLKNEVFNLTLRVHLSNLFQYHPEPFIVKAAIPVCECLYPEHAYPILRKAILRELELNIDDFIETYRDDITHHHVAYFKFIPTYRKDKKS